MKNNKCLQFTSLFCYEDVSNSKSKGEISSEDCVNNTLMINDLTVFQLALFEMYFLKYYYTLKFKFLIKNEII